MEPRDRYAAGEPEDRKRRRRKAGWLWLLLALLVALAIALVVAFAGGNSDGNDSSSGTSSAKSSSSGVKGASTTKASSGSGSLTSGSTDVLERASAGSLASLNGKNVRADRVRVVSVVGDEVFWVGSSGDSRVLVHLTHTMGESAPTVRAGDRVEFTGKVAPNGKGDTGMFGITKSEDSALYKSQKVHIEAPASTLELS